MHWVDLVIVAIIAWFTFSAFSVGLIREAVTVIAVIAGAVLAGHFYAELAADIEFLISDETVRNFVSFLAIFVGIAVLGQLVAMTLRRVAALLMLGPLDHFGGALFGFAKGLLLVEVLLIAATAFPVTSGVDDALDSSALAPVFLDSVPVMLSVLPDEFSEALVRIDGGVEPAPAESGPSASGIR